jgi:hypothetical protein
MSVIKNWYNLAPNPIKPYIHSIVDKLGLGAHTELIFSSALRDQGWFKSYRTAPVNEHGQPIPWLPYCFIDFLSPRLDDEWEIFEYGSGNSTHYFADRVNRIVAVESDKHWYDRVSGQSKDNENIIFREQTAHAEAIDDFENFDIIVIDGEQRIECAKKAVTHLSSGGVIIWDDTFRSEYQPGIDYLVDRGFSQISFAGMAPVNAQKKQTSVFYRQDNCLNI